MNFSKFNKFICFLLPSIISCNDEANLSLQIKISAWGADVSSTKNVLETGLFEGDSYQYVVSSYPVITAVKNSNPNIEIYENITTKFATKYSVKGFPQAGLFINSELENNSDNEDLITSFLTLFDNTINSLVDEKLDVINYMNSYSTNLSDQNTYFGFNSNVLKSVIEGNKLNFINNTNNPSWEELKKFKDIFNYDFSEEKLSKYYLKSFNNNVSDLSNLKISVPYGAPAASVLPLTYINDSINKNVDFTTPINIRSSLLSGNKDFVIFDATTGINITSKYKLVRMVTYGNLYLVSTGNDENKKLDTSDKIFGYGEDLIVGKVTKEVYEK